MHLRRTDEELASDILECAAVPHEHARHHARLPFSRKAGYGAGQLVELIVENMLNIFMLFYATGIMLILLYRINRRSHDQIIAELNERRRAESAYT